MYTYTGEARAWHYPPEVKFGDEDFDEEDLRVGIYYHCNHVHVYTFKERLEVAINNHYTHAALILYLLACLLVFMYVCTCIYTLCNEDGCFSNARVYMLWPFNLLHVIHSL